MYQIKREDVIGPPKLGRKVAIFGDTCDSTAMTSLCSNCDVVVHETTLENELFESCLDKGHSTPGVYIGYLVSFHLHRILNYGESE